MKGSVILVVAAAVLATASGEKCVMNRESHLLAKSALTITGASAASSVQSACECEEDEMKSYCFVGTSEVHLCCIPKGLSCRTKPSETDRLPEEKRLSKNQWKICAEDESFCNGEQLILPSSDTAKFPDGKDPVCGVEGTEAFDVAKKLGIPLSPCAGSFFDRCECEEGETKIMRPYGENFGKKTLQPDCEAAGASENSDDAKEPENTKSELDQAADKEAKLEDEEDKKEDEEDGQSTPSLRSNKSKKKTEDAFFADQNKLETDDKKSTEDNFFK